MGHECYRDFFFEEPNKKKIQNAHVDLRFDAGADGVDAPPPGVVVVEVHPGFTKPVGTGPVSVWPV